MILSSLLASSSSVTLFSLLSTAVMRSYESLGGTGPMAVAQLCDDLRAELAQHSGALAADTARVADAFEASRAIAKAVGPKGTHVASVDDLAAIIDHHRPRAMTMTA